MSTVSRTINGVVFVEESTRNKVLDAVSELNYQPNYLAKGLKSGKTSTICLIVPSIRNPSINIFSRGVEDASRRNGYTLILCNTDENPAIEKQYIDKMQSNWVDGMVFCTATHNSEILDYLYSIDYPIVLAIREYKENFDTFSVDNFKGGYKATKFLIEKGFRRIGILSGRLDLNLYAERLEGYKQALKDFGLPFNHDFVISAEEREKANIRFDPTIATVMSREVKPDSFFAMGDLIAINAINEMRKINIFTPMDISIIGFDDIDISPLVSPSLTTVSQPLYQIGIKATERLIKRIRSKKKLDPVMVKFEPEIIEREST